MLSWHRSLWMIQTDPSQKMSLVGNDVLLICSFVSGGKTVYLVKKNHQKAKNHSNIIWIPQDLEKKLTLMIYNSTGTPQFGCNLTRNIVCFVFPVWKVTVKWNAKHLTLNCKPLPGAAAQRCDNTLQHQGTHYKHTHTHTCAHIVCLCFICLWWIHLWHFSRET